MAFDALEFKGWAQVLNQPNSQLGQIAALKQRQQQVNADQALKQQQADEKWWNDNVKLGFDNVRNELQQHEAELFKATHGEMVNTQKEILAGRMNQNEGRTKILQLQNITTHSARHSYSHKLNVAGFSKEKTGLMLGNDAATADKYYKHFESNDVLFEALKVIGG